LDLRGKREWRKLHNEELNYLYSSIKIVWVIKSRMRWARHVARMGESRGVYRMGMDWIELAQDMDRWRALVNVVMNLRII